MIRKEIKFIYYCGFCSKKYLRPTMCLKHEVSCSKNPDNQHQCWNCENLSVKKNEHERVRGFRCKAKEVDLYSYKVDHQQSAYFVQIKKTATRMPNQDCEQFLGGEPETVQFVEYKEYETA